MKRLVAGFVLGVLLTWGVQAASQARDPNVSMFALRKTPTVAYAPLDRLSSPQIEVLYDNRGAMFGLAYENQIGQSYLYDSAGRYQGMIQSWIQPNR